MNLRPAHHCEKKGLTINLLCQPSSRSTCGRLQGKKAELTIKIFSVGKGNNKKRNRQIFLTVSAFFLRAYARCGPEGCQYRRSNRCDKLNHEFYCFFFSHSRSLVLVLITLCFVISSPLLVISSPLLVISSAPPFVISSVVERSLHALRLVEMTVALGKGWGARPQAPVV